MKGTPAIRIAIVGLVVLLVIGGILVFAWPTAEPERTASTRTPAPLASSTPSSPQPAPAPSPAPAPAPAVTAAVDALKSLSNEVGPKKDDADRAPSFDVARIEPNGEAVIGGRAAPGAAVELLRGGVIHARAVADPSGEFVIVPDPLPPGSYDLTLRATGKDGKVSTSKDSIAVVLQADKKDKPVVALAEPDKPSVVLSKPAEDPSGAPGLAIDAVEGEAGGKMYVSGRAPQGSKVNLYLNDAYIASATTSSEGRIAFSIRSGIQPGDYRVRLDQVDASGRVQKRAEVPFNAPVAVAAAAPSATPAPATGDTANKLAAASTGTPSAPPPAAAPKPPAPPEPPASQAPPPRETASTSAAQPPSPAAAEPAASPRPGPAPQTASAPREETSPTTAPPPSPAAPDPAASQQVVAATATPAPKSTSTPDTASGVVVIPRVDTMVVVRGDNLWRISRSTYGRGERYSVIYRANRDQIRDPDLIYPGQIFVLPKDRQ